MINNEVEKVLLSVDLTTKIYDDGSVVTACLCGWLRRFGSGAEWERDWPGQFAPHLQFHIDATDWAV